MARKSNKTAHVLNLIAGHDSHKEVTEISTEEAATVALAAESSSSAAASTHDSAPAAAPGASGPQNISLIDTTTKDPVAELIQEKLADELQQQTPGTAPEVPESSPQTESASQSTIETETSTASQPTIETETSTASQPTIETETSTASQPAVQTETSTASQPAIETETSTASQPAVQTETSTASQPAVQTETSTASQPATQTEPIPVSQPAPQTEPAVVSQPAAEPEPEPDFVRVNVMEEIVKDKIIYFMRQFDVCTCDRCVSDTIALTLSGMLPKYIVTTPAAVDPLLSYYTNKYISDVTVEATKACMTVKDNPRH